MLFCALTVVLTAHQRQINNSKNEQKDICSFRKKKIKNAGNIYRLKLTVHNLHARLGSIFCVTHAEITGMWYITVIVTV